ncbi:hypothetical protein HK096_000806, partial [Nowakowskiella sp. JEL0078]
MASGCASFSARLTSALGSSSAIKAAIVNLPLAYTSSADRQIIDLRQTIAESKIPLYQIEVQSFSDIVSKTLSTVGVGDLSRYKNYLALVLQVVPATSIEPASTTPLQYSLIIIGVLILLFIPLMFYLRSVQRRAYIGQMEAVLEDQRLERDRIELDRLRQDGIVVNNEELQSLPIAKIEDLGMETLTDFDEVMTKSVLLHVEKAVGVKSLFNKKLSQSPSLSSVSPEPSSSISGGGIPTKAICSICLEALKTQDLYRKLHCSHLFHVECIDVWLVKRSRFCPLCRIDVINGVHEDNSESHEN